MFRLSIVLKLLMILGSFLIGLGICECLLAFFSPQVYNRPPGVWQFDSRLGWRHVPNAHGRLVTPEFDVEIRINSEGLRGPEIQKEKSTGVRRLLVFGDSFAEGWGVEEENMFSFYLQQCLSETNPHTEVLNFGVAGYGTDQAYLLFQEIGSHYQADDVILLFYGNDLWNNASKRGIGAERGQKPFFRKLLGGDLRLEGVPVNRTQYWDESKYGGNTIWESTKHYLRSHYHLYALFIKLIAEDMKVGKVSAYYDGLYGEDPRKKWNSVWHLTELIIRDFNDYVVQTGSRFHLLYVPSIVQVEATDWKNKKELHGLVGSYKLDKPNKILRAITERYGISFLDLLPIFHAKGKEKTLYLRDSHWNKEGHYLAATNACGRLRKFDLTMGPK